MKQNVTYKEPAGYFTPSMLKVAEEWDREHEKAEKKAKSDKKKKNK